jgi:predicted ATP-dependent endonuclease of OLD family
MNIKKVSIKHFRGIEDLPSFELKNLSMLIGNNGTSKTSILEAINFALSPSFLSGRIKHTDFYKGQDNPIEITLEFLTPFKAMLPDGFLKQEVECNKVYLKIKKRDRAGNGKAFSDIVVVEHYVVPVAPRTNDKGWEIFRKNNSKFKFDHRLLTFPIETEGLPRCFYYGKNREKQIQKGYNSSISSVYDDFNWRFIKEVRKESDTPTESETPDFFARKQFIENEIIQKIDEKVIEKTFNTLNKKLDDLGIENIGMSFFDGHAPFDTAYLNQKLEGLEIPVTQLGSGIEMIISLLFLETLASLSKEKFIVVIDEPELHLHPTLQNKFLNYLVELAASNQVLLSTHSPYFFKNSIANQNIELLISSKDTGKVDVKNTSTNFGLFPWSPSWGEINFHGYNLPTIEFHNELYGYLQEANTASSETVIETFFESKGQTKTKQWKRLHNGQVGSLYDVTLMTYIRNSIHHPDNTSNLPYTETELNDSIKTMISILKTP